MEGGLIWGFEADLALDLAADLGTCLDLGATGLAVVAFAVFAVFAGSLSFAAGFDVGRDFAGVLEALAEAADPLVFASFFEAIVALVAFFGAALGAVALAVLEDAFSLAEDIECEPLGFELDPFGVVAASGLADRVFFCAALGEEAAARCLDLVGIPVLREIDFSPLNSRGFGYRKGEKGRAISKRRFCRSRIC